MHPFQKFQRQGSQPAIVALLIFGALLTAIVLVSEQFGNGNIENELTAQLFSSSDPSSSSDSSTSDPSSSSDSSISSVLENCAGICDECETDGNVCAIVSGNCQCIGGSGGCALEGFECFEDPSGACFCESPAPNGCYTNANADGSCPSGWITLGMGCYPPAGTPCFDESSPCSNGFGICAAGACICDAVCGDGIPDLGETCASCPADVQCQSGTQCCSDGSCQVSCGGGQCAAGFSCLLDVTHSNCGINDITVCQGTCSDGVETADCCQCQPGGCSSNNDCTVLGECCDINTGQCSVNACGGGQCGDGIPDAEETCASCPADVLCQSGTQCCSDGSCQVSCGGGGQCGDGVVDDGEQCESASDCSIGESCVGCSCTHGTSVCGNDRIDPGEECEETSDCTNNEFCGNSCQCDPVPASCGNTIIDAPNEQCDDGGICNGGTANGSMVTSVQEAVECVRRGGSVIPQNSDGCTAQCILEHLCGNGIVEFTESCDDGGTCTAGNVGQKCTLLTVQEDCGVIGICEPQDGDGCNASCGIDECSILGKPGSMNAYTWSLYDLGVHQNGMYNAASYSPPADPRGLEWFSDEYKTFFGLYGAQGTGNDIREVPFIGPVKNVPLDPSYFASKWEGVLHVPERGNYTYHFGARDDIWVIIDGVVHGKDTGLKSAITTNRRSIILQPGDHTVEVYYASRTPADCRMLSEIACEDERDDDRDTLIDCADSDCSFALACGGTGCKAPEQCDAEGSVSCPNGSVKENKGTACANGGQCVLCKEIACNDDLDNDGDLRIDEVDNDCQNLQSALPSSIEQRSLLNLFVGKAHAEEIDVLEKTESVEEGKTPEASMGSVSSSDSFFSKIFQRIQAFFSALLPDGSSLLGQVAGTPQCSDGLDNNNDGTIDFATYVNTVYLPQWEGIADILVDPAHERTYVLGTRAGGPDPKFSFSDPVLWEIDSRTFAILREVALPTNILLYYQTDPLIDTTRRIAYFAATDTTQRSAQIIRVDLAAMQLFPESTLTLPANSGPLGPAVIDTANNFAYYARRTGLDVGSKIMKINLNTFQWEAEIGTDAITERHIVDAVIDPAAGYAYFGASPGQDPRVPAARIIKVQLNPFQKVQSVSLDATDADIDAMAINPGNNTIYVSTHLKNDGEKMLLRKIQISPFEFTTGTVQILEPENYNWDRTTVMDTQRQMMYVGVHNADPSVTKINLIGEQQDAIYRMPDKRVADDAVIDTAFHRVLFSSNDQISINGTDQDGIMIISTANRDPTCSSASDALEGTPPPPPPAACSDGLDNDGDGLVDRDDPGCYTFNNRITGTYNPNDNVEPNTIQCGNGGRETGEQCDDGNTLNTDICSNACQRTICGDGIIQSPNGQSVLETCDNGLQNGQPGQCNLTCTGVVSSTPQCNDATDNDNDTRNNCLDPGCHTDDNAANASTCDPNDTTEANTPRCGNGVQDQPSEQCDDGNLVAGDGCSIICTSEGCGDGQTDPQEQCDDGNSSNVDSCPDGTGGSCRSATCGDGFVWTAGNPNPAGPEICDDKTENGQPNRCNSSCAGTTASSCGNGYVEQNEQCDDGNLTGGDGCAASCQNEPQTICKEVFGATVETGWSMLPSAIDALPNGKFVVVSGHDGQARIGMAEANGTINWLTGPSIFEFDSMPPGFPVPADVAWIDENRFVVTYSRLAGSKAIIGEKVGGVIEWGTPVNISLTVFGGNATLKNVAVTRLNAEKFAVALRKNSSELMVSIGTVNNNRSIAIGNDETHFADSSVDTQLAITAIDAGRFVVAYSFRSLTAGSFGVAEAFWAGTNGIQQIGLPRIFVSGMGDLGIPIFLELDPLSGTTFFVTHHWSGFPIQQFATGTIDPVSGITFTASTATPPSALAGMKNRTQLVQQILGRFVIAENTTIKASYCMQCQDGVDNADMEDTLIDAADLGCVNILDNDERNVCADDFDNDGDARIDQNDPGCYTNGNVSIPTDYSGVDMSELNTVQCGNGSIETVSNVLEQCDDGNLVVGDGCSALCKREECGNMIRDPGEECDDQNQNNNDGCLTTCQNASCGDSFVRTGVEQCDNGASNSNTTPNACRLDCRNPRCGDGFEDNSVLDSGETCDQGVLNGLPTRCNATCTGPTPAVCGNNAVEAPTEQCDFGDGNNNDECPDGTNGTCQLATCGDGHIWNQLDPHTNNQGTEVCDDGNTSTTDACPSGETGNPENLCKPARCGDGFIRNGVELCDDGDGINSDSCPDGTGGSCRAASCGDGFLWNTDGGTEVCDDGNGNRNDSCPDGAGLTCAAARCGDGLLWNTDGGTEECDMPMQSMVMVARVPARSKMPCSART